MLARKHLLILDLAEEIENLRRESQALKHIRQSMGSKDFVRKIFEKVFQDDIDRLRSMEDMWKTRKAPSPLNFDQVLREAHGVDASVALRDQQTWTLLENFTVFSDRYEIDSLRIYSKEDFKTNPRSLIRLSDRLKRTQLQVNGNGAPPILTFDKDDDDTLDFVAASANLRSFVFGIERRSKFDIKRKSKPRG